MAAGLFAFAVMAGILPTGLFVLGIGAIFCIMPVSLAFFRNAGDPLLNQLYSCIPA